MSKHLSPEIRVPIEPGNPAIMRRESLCIRCGKCRDVCRDEIGESWAIMIWLIRETFPSASTADSVPMCAPWIPLQKRRKRKR